MSNKKSLPRAATQLADTKSQLQNKPTDPICQETRFESFMRCEPNKRCRMILDALGDKEMTARQIARALGFYERNATAPRLSEMVDKGMVEVAGKAYDSLTKRYVSTYRRVGQ